MPRTVDKVPATNITALIAKHGTVRAAKLLGLSKSSVADMANRGQTRKAYEIAAGALLEQREQTTIAVIRVTKAEDLPYIRKMLSGLGVRMLEFREDP